MIVSGASRKGQVGGSHPSVRWTFALAAIFSLFLGCEKQPVVRIAKTRVTGASMSPTIFGEHARLDCVHCKITWRANWQPELRPRGSIVCWNCGGEVDRESIRSIAGQSVLIDLEAYAKTLPEMGDVVAIRDDHGTRLKRIVATPGQRISTRGDLLYRDDVLMQTPAPWMIVHDDSYRRDNNSWWEPSTTCWTQTDAGFDGKRDASDSTNSLRYAHVLPYQHGASDCVRDDYPCNLSESRQLRAIATLRLEADVEVHRPAELLVAFWSTSGPREHAVHLRKGSARLDVDSTVGELADGDTSWEAIDEKHPIAIVLHSGEVSLRNLIVRRPLLYWNDGQADSSPTELAGDEFYVVGDNVPLSIDSRQQGPIKRSSIVGRQIEK